MVDSFSGQLLYPSYSPGTQAYINAVKTDYERNLISPEQMHALLAGYADPITGAMVKQQPSGWSAFFTGLTGAVGVLGTTYNKLSQLELQKAQNEYRLQAAKNTLATGLAGEGLVPGFGGINVFTLIALGVVILAAMFLLKKT